MGSSVSLYLGPYLKVRNEKVDSIQKVRACGNDACKRAKTESKDKFCSACGQPIKPVSFAKKEDKINLHEITEKWNDQLYANPHVESGEGYEYLLPNIYTPLNMRDFSLDANYDSEVIENYDEKIKVAEEKAWFEKTFQNEIEALKEHLKEVTVGWGFIRYWS